MLRNTVRYPEPAVFTGGSSGREIGGGVITNAWGEASRGAGSGGSGGSGGSRPRDPNEKKGWLSSLDAMGEPGGGGYDLLPYLEEGLVSCVPIHGRVGRHLAETRLFPWGHPETGFKPDQLSLHLTVLTLTLSPNYAPERLVEAIKHAGLNALARHVGSEAAAHFLFVIWALVWLLLLIFPVLTIYVVRDTNGASSHTTQVYTGVISLLVPFWAVAAAAAWRCKCIEIKDAVRNEGVIFNKNSNTQKKLPKKIQKIKKEFQDQDRDQGWLSKIPVEVRRWAGSLALLAIGYFLFRVVLSLRDDGTNDVILAFLWGFIVRLLGLPFTLTLTL